MFVSASAGSLGFFEISQDFSRFTIQHPGIDSYSLSKISWASIDVTTAEQCDGICCSYWQLYT